MTLIKVCGITNVEDAVAAVNHGAHFLGFVFAESPRRVETATVKHIQRMLAGNVKTVGVFTDESDDVPRIIDECGLDYAQLHGYQSEDFARKIGAYRVIRAMRVKNEYSIENLAEFPEAAYYLLDTYRPGTAGGTGETFDWNLAARAHAFGRPIFLSGGLKPENAADAVRTVRPFAVDVSSGVEQSPGVKDHARIKEFIDNVRTADNNP